MIASSDHTASIRHLNCSSKVPAWPLDASEDHGLLSSIIWSGATPYEVPVVGV